MAEKAKISDSELLASAMAEIRIGLAMARAAGVVCGAPYGVRIVRGNDTPSG